MITDCILSGSHKWFCVRILYQGSTLMYMFIWWTLWWTIWWKL